MHASELWCSFVFVFFSAFLSTVLEVDKSATIFIHWFQPLNQIVEMNQGQVALLPGVDIYIYIYF